MRCDATTIFRPIFPPTSKAPTSPVIPVIACRLINRLAVAGPAGESRRQGHQTDHWDARETAVGDALLAPNPAGAAALGAAQALTKKAAATLRRLDAFFAVVQRVRPRPGGAGDRRRLPGLSVICVQKVPLRKARKINALRHAPQGRPKIGGIMPPLQIPALDWQTPRTGGRSQNRAFRCKPRNEPEAGGRRRARTIASVATCSFAD
jgi:hypothetical protein